jgi:hypothetical protein
VQPCNVKRKISFVIHLLLNKDTLRYRLRSWKLILNNSIKVIQVFELYEIFNNVYKIVGPLNTPNIKPVRRHEK